MDLSSYIFIDHHAHPLVRRQMELDGFAFRQCFTESRSQSFISEFVPDSFHYTNMLNLLQTLLGVEGEGGVLSWRSIQERTEYVRNLLDDMGFGAMIIDDGYAPPDSMPLAQMASISGRPVFACRRIETVLESAIGASNSFAELVDIFNRDLVAEHVGGGGAPIALKTIMGYRGGLELDAATAAQAEADYFSVKHQFQSANRCRIERRPLYHYFLKQAFELAACHNLPVQIHTGLGDDDADLVRVNPALLQPLFRSPELRHTKFVLLHCYPYIREAAMMASLYPNVYMDLSLAVNLISARAEEMILEALACAPSTKLLAGTDAHTCVEAFWYGANVWKSALGSALQQLLDRGYLTKSQAEQAAANVLHGNAMNLYQLKDGIG